MLKRGSKLYAIRKYKCPRCHQGDLFKTSLASMQGVYNMYPNCPKCNQDFEMEPGFYWGAMYVGYGLYCFYMLGTIAVLIFGFGLTVNQSFGTALAIGVIMVPVIARLARVQWINIAVRYNKRIADKIAAQDEAS